MRKVIQIAGLPEDTLNGWEPGVIALCDDNSVWIKTSGATNWVEIEPIPQDEQTLLEKK